MVQDNHPSPLGILKLFPPERPHFTQTPTFPAMALRDKKQGNIWTTDFETTHMAGLMAEVSLEDKCETPSQQCDTDTELWTWKLKLLVMSRLIGWTQNKLHIPSGSSLHFIRSALKIF